MERKYRQRGYMDSDRDQDRAAKVPPSRKEHIGPRTLAMPAKREVVRCASCATLLPIGIDMQGLCPKCGAELHCCKQCAFFDTASRFECTQPITARIPKKDGRNHCGAYSPRTTIERETSSSRPLDARQAFENLFRK